MAAAKTLIAINSLIDLLENQHYSAKVVFVTLEFVKDSLFSGNGVYARTMVFALIQSGFEVMVICASNTTRETLSC